MSDTDEVTELFTDYVKKHDVELAKCDLTITLRIPDAGEYKAAATHADENEEDDLVMGFYILRRFCVKPDLNNVSDQGLKDMVTGMHPIDLQIVIFSFLGVSAEAVMDMAKGVDLEKVRSHFRKEEPEHP
jgi:hypothetical protein